MDTYKPGIYLVVEFNWPEPFEEQHGKLARALHDSVHGQNWIRESVAGSGGIGGKFSSLWVFWLEDYAALDRLLKDKSDPISQTYTAFFSQMKSVRDQVREEVCFA